MLASSVSHLSVYLRLYVYLCLCVYLCLYVCLCLCVYIRLYVYACISTYVCMSTYACMSTYTGVSTPVCLRTLVCLVCRNVELSCDDRRVVVNNSGARMNRARSADDILDADNVDVTLPPPKPPLRHIPANLLSVHRSVCLAARDMPVSPLISLYTVLTVALVLQRHF